MIDPGRPRSFHGEPLPTVGAGGGDTAASRDGRVRVPLPRGGKPVPGIEVDTRELERALREALDGEVRFDAAYRAAYSTDASHYRQVPIGVVLPRSKEDVERAVAICHERGVPVLARGGGTSLAGQCCNVAVVLDFSRHLNRVLEIDPERRLARVEPGCVLDNLREEAAKHGLTFGPDPATHSRCVLGGMIGNNSCGIHSVQAQWHTGPRTSDNVSRLEVLTYDGTRFWAGETPQAALEDILAEGGRRAEIYRSLLDLRDANAEEIRRRFPDIPRRVSGYNLDELLPEKGFNVARAVTGSESTCVLVLEAELQLIPMAEASTLAVVGFRDVYHAADAVTAIMPYEPIGLEGLDHRLIDYMRRKHMRQEDVRLLPEGDAFLLVQFGGEDKEEANAHARELAGHLEDGTLTLEGQTDVLVLTDEEEEGRLWEVRESGLGATAFVPGQSPSWPGWEDTAVPPEKLGDYLREFRRLLDEFGYAGAFYGHFGQGLLHTRIDFQLEHRQGLEQYLRFCRAVASLVTRYGGSLSGEHGDGQSRGALLGKMFGPRIVEAFRVFKAIWDPDWRMNPGKVIDAYLPDQNLFIDPSFDPPARETWFRFPQDNGSFVDATMRCVGVGKCRREGGGTMCPSYMVTKEEIHSTRGRARLLFEMARGGAIEDDWRSDAVHEALDLCLSCKGCKGDCPVSVDMATYKAEFYAHYYAKRLRPRQAYAFGWIWWWARAASRTPRLVNWLAHTQPFSGLARRLAHVHPERTLPHFAERTFVRRFEDEMAPVNPSGRKVILWPDTFNNFFRPDTAVAGARVLEALGYQVVLPPQPLCCGRPLYDFGFLGLARKLLRRTLDALHDDIRDGVPVVGLEPSCVSTFRDEVTALFPEDKQAHRLAKQTFLLGEFLERYAAGAELPRVGGRGLLHGHCHQKAVLDFDADRKVLERLGMEVEVPDSGCCGMAGPFGFDRDHYDVAQACGERVLIPAVANRRDGTSVIADGFSCRTMIEQNVQGARPRHLAEVVWDALRSSGPLRWGPSLSERREAPTHEAGERRS